MISTSASPSATEEGVGDRGDDGISWLCAKGGVRARDDEAATDGAREETRDFAVVAATAAVKDNTGVGIAERACDGEGEGSLAGIYWNIQRGHAGGEEAKHA